MAVTYLLRSTTSDGPGAVGADFEADLTTAAPGSSSPVTVSVANSSTEISYAWTTSGKPGTGGATGNYTIEANITSADSNILLAVQVRRVNSGGTVQTSSGVTAEQSCGSTGVKTFTFTSLSLGTWAVGDRLRVDYRFRSTKTHGGAASVALDRNTTNCEVVTPFTPATITQAVGAASEGDTSAGMTAAAKTKRITPPGWPSYAG